MDQYDYVELVIFDIHSIPRGRLVARRRLESILEKGIGLYSAMCYFGCRHEPNATDYFAKNRNYSNGFLVPIVDTLVDVPPSGCGEQRVGQVLCDLKLEDGSLEPTTPRYMAQRQLEKLSKLGYNIRSAFELEFTILDQKQKPWGHINQWANMSVITKNEDLLVGMLEEMSSSGVKVDTLQAECGPGQFEVTLDVAEGLKGPDMTTRFKTFSKTFLKKRGLEASFMTKLEENGLSNGFHFNHSLWTPSGANAFLDHKEPQRFSKLAKHWLAGLIAHAEALTALCCPTVNCYRRLHKSWAPHKTDWAFQDRRTTFRLTTAADNFYIECRLPSSACNAYLVMAGIVAAGMDGLVNQLALEEANQDVVIPNDLETSLKKLEEDAVLVEALGKEFVDCYVHVKRKYETEVVEASGTSYELEREMYIEH